MKVLTHYIALTMLKSIGLTVFCLLGIEFIFSLVSELNNVGTGDYGILPALYYLLLSMPQKIYQLFPMAALVGTLMGLGILASHSELIVMRAAGLSKIQLSKVVFKTALGLAIATWLIGEGMGPYLDKLANDSKALALSGGQALKTAHGTWIRDGNEFIHVRALYVGGHLEGITRYQFNEKLKLQKAITASYADYIDQHWILYDIHETNFNQQDISQQHYAQQIWQSFLTPGILSVVGEKYLDRLSLKGLWRTIGYRSANGLDIRPYQLAFAEKIMQPFATTAMMLLAIPFIFGPLRNTSMGLKIVTGIFIGFCFYIFNELFGHLALVYGMSPFFGAALPTMVVAAAGGAALYRSG
jgi:lipopolysaccharide export system permease protein